MMCGCVNRDPALEAPAHLLCCMVGPVLKSISPKRDGEHMDRIGDPYMYAKDQPAHEQQCRASDTG